MMGKCRFFLWVVISGLMLGACGKDSFPKYNRLGGLRVLALKVDQPEVAPGTVVHLTPLLSDLGGVGRALNWKAEGCVDPGVGFGAEPSCETAADRVSLGGGVVAPVLTAPAYTQAVAPIDVTVPADIHQNRTLVDQWNGVAYLVTYEVWASDGTQVKAIKRVIASTRTQKNSNPSLLDVLQNGASLVALPSESVSLSVKIATGSAESYTALTVDERQVSRNETLITTWFVSDGEMERARVIADSANSYTPPITNSAVIIPVVRDGRGGEDYLIRSF